MLAIYQADLHIHTCLSPCAELEMGPRNIVREARRQGLDVIGICDHNTSENTPAVMHAARGTGVKVLPGMEVTSREEAHVLALFDGLEQAWALQRVVYRHLPARVHAGEDDLQPVVDEQHEVRRFNPHPLGSATDLSVDQVVGWILRFRGLAVASHVDRESFSIIGQLGFVPPELPLDALELSRNTSLDEARKMWVDCTRRPLIRNSDAHRVAEIGAAKTRFLISEPTVAELRAAMRGRRGRRMLEDREPERLERTVPER